MKRRIFSILLIVSLLGIPFFAFGILNTMVSLKYETDNMNNCISLVNGHDLCLALRINQILLVACILIPISLLIFKKKILKK